MSAPQPTTVATSGGHRIGGRTKVIFDSLVHHAVGSSGAHSRRPRGMCVGTAIGDAEFFTARLSEAARMAGFDLTRSTSSPCPIRRTSRAPSSNRTWSG